MSEAAGFGWNGERWVPSGLRPAAASAQIRRPVSPWGIAAALLACLLVATVGALSLAWAAAGHWPRVTVFPTRAVVAEPLSDAACNRGQPLVITIEWRGRPVRTEDDGPACNGDYLPGQRLTVYVGSDGPFDVGPDANWILNPDTHDPFEFLGGPNDIHGSLYFWGVILLTGGVSIGSAVALWARRNRTTNLSAGTFGTFVAP